MTDFIAEASDTDLADQAVPVGDPADESDLLTVNTTGEADAADVFEQHQSVPSPDDDYDR